MDVQTHLEFNDGERSQNAGRNRCLTVAGLFAGIGGIERGLSSAGHTCSFLCENDQHALAVLRKRFPDVRLHQDVRALKSLPAVDLLTAGFPCQDLSPAGKMRGIGGAKSGIVWEAFRLIDTRPPDWVLLENVPFMLKLHAGRALGMIVSALEDRGYKWAYRVVDARSFGLPQRRERVFLLASLTHDPREVLLSEDAGEQSREAKGRRPCGFYWTEGNRGLGWAVDAVPTLKGGSGLAIPSPPAIWCLDGGFVTPDIRDAERLQGFPADWTKPAEAVGRASRRWGLIGNAVSVPVARWIGQRLRNPKPCAPASARRLRNHDGWPNCAWNVGEGRYSIDASAFPKAYARKSIGAFLIYPPKPLSLRAAQGFLGRVTRSSLRCDPRFIRELAAYVAGMEKPLPQVITS
jgi:DNA (cytosine-5)-methyltransferase 1